MRFVGGTRIFARAIDEARQVLAYSMNVEIDEELAMVLPLPVPPSSADDAVAFINLEGYAKLFDDLEAAFPPDYSAMPQAKGRSLLSLPDKPKLVVHDVGMFEASFVPTREDFARLDDRFRLSDVVWETLPQYADFGFTVFRLKPAKRRMFGLKSSRQRIHPMAFSFPRRDPKALFFPTVHVHDGGTVPERANFDHMLFCQADGVLDATLPWDRSGQPLSAHVSSEKSRGLVDTGRKGRRTSMWGSMLNRDVELRAPEGVTTEDLTGHGDAYSYAIRASYAYLHEPQKDAQRRAWQGTAQTRLGALAKGLRDGLRDVTSARHDSWSLTRLSASLPAHFVNGNQLWTGTSYMDGSPAKPGGLGRVTMQIFSELVEPQEITLAFAKLPDQEHLDAIRAELRALVDRARKGGEISTGPS